MGRTVGEVAPKVAWAARAGGVSLDSAHALAMDASGNLYVVGVFAGSANFGGTTLTATVGSDLFLAKLSPAGSWLWAKDIEAGVPGIERFFVQVDSLGNPVVCTTIAGDAAGDGLNVGFVAKFTPLGALTWSKKFKPGGLSSVIVGGIALDASNNIYLTGLFGNRVDFGGVTLTDAGSGDIFLIKLGPAGNLLFARRFGNPGPVMDGGRGVEVDALGNVYLLANFGGSVAFGGATLTSTGGTDVALVRFDSSLNPQAAIRLGNVGDDQAEGLIRNASNQLMILGAFSEDTMLGTTRITPDLAGQLVLVQADGSGSITWVKPLGPSSVSVSGSRGFVADAVGDVFVVTGGRLLKVGPGGAVVWERTSGPTLGFSAMNGMVVQNHTNVYVAGTLNGTGILDGVTVNSAGFDDALVAKLVIDTTPPPVITVQPKAQSFPMGSTAAFSITATGQGPLKYQWYFGQKPIVGATTATLAVTNLILLNTGVYSVVVANAGGETRSQYVGLEVTIPPPSILQAPLGATINLGQDAQFTVSAKGYEPLFYQWRSRGTNLSLANSSLYVIRGASTNDAGPYTVVVGNLGGYTTSSVAMLTVRIIPPTIRVQPQAVTMAEGGTAVFQVDVVGSAPMKYQWQRNGVNLPGQTGTSLTLEKISEADVANYRVVVSNAAGATQSIEASLSLQQPLLQGDPFTWTAAIHSLCGDTYEALTTDGAGNVYVAARQPNLQLPGFPNPSGCGYGFGVGKLDAQGRGVWVVSAAGVSALKSTVANLQLDASGNLWVVGTYSGAAMTFKDGGPTFPVAVLPSVFLAKYTPDGKLIWARRATGASAADMVLDNSGAAFVAGVLSGSGTAAPAISIFGSTNVSTIKPRPYVARVNANGDFVWVHAAGVQSAGATASSLALDPGGDLWLAGQFTGTFEYEGQTFSSVYPPPNLAQRRSVFLARLSPSDGVPRWVKMYQSEQSMEAVTRVGAHPQGGAVFACDVNGRFKSGTVDVSFGSYGGLVCRVDPNGVPNGAFFEERRIQSAAVSATGSVFLAAAAMGEATYGGFLLRPPNGQNQALLLQLDPDLKPVLARHVAALKPLESTYPLRVVMTPSGDAWFTGYFSGSTIAFGPLVTKLAQPGGSFLAMLASQGNPAVAEIKAVLAPGKLVLSWPVGGGWQLQSTRLLGSAFGTTLFTPSTNTVTGMVTVEVPIDSLGTFYRLAKP